MDENEALKKLKLLKFNTDIEQAHGLADEIILSFCPKAVQDAFNEIEKFYA